MNSDHVWLTRKAAAIYLRKLGVPVAAQTLAIMAIHNNSGGGPAFTRSGWKTVRYLTTDLDIWAKQRIRKVGRGDNDSG
jgi:hypothetical protein